MLISGRFGVDIGGFRVAIKHGKLHKVGTWKSIDFSAGAIRARGSGMRSESLLELRGAPILAMEACNLLREVGHQPDLLNYST